MRRRRGDKGVPARQGLSHASQVGAKSSRRKRPETLTVTHGALLRSHGSGRIHTPREHTRGGQTAVRRSLSSVGGLPPRDRHSPPTPSSGLNGCCILNN